MLFQLAVLLILLIVLAGLLSLRRGLTRLLLTLLGLLALLGLLRLVALLRCLVIRVRLARSLGVSGIGLVVRDLCAVCGLIPALLGLLTCLLAGNLLWPGEPVL